MVNTPICCPSRTERFTGRYFHNVESNDKGNCMLLDTKIFGSKTTGLFWLLKQNDSPLGNVKRNQIVGLE